jgi:hypothetical protein
MILHNLKLVSFLVKLKQKTNIASPKCIFVGISKTHIIQQSIGIPMGTNCAFFKAELFLIPDAVHKKKHKISYKMY